MPRRPKEDRAAKLGTLAPIEAIAPVEALAPIDDRTGPEPMDRIGRPLARRLGVSVPGAIGGALLVCALAFGANLTSGAAPSGSGFDLDEASIAGGDVTAPSASDASLAWTGGGTTGGDDKDGKGGDDAAPTDGSKAAGEDAAPSDKPMPADEPAAKATPKAEQPDKREPKPAAKPRQAEAPKPKPSAKPVLGLKLAANDGAVLVDWSACKAKGADYYKVVRSKDSTVRWPAGGNDTAIAAVEIGGATKTWDKHAPAGKRAWYRVFCVRHTDAGYKVLSASAAKSITAPKPKPAPVPQPADMWLEVDVEGAAATLHWEACDSDGFSHYRILRKAGGDAQVIAEIGDHGVTTYVDDGLDAGSYSYLVQSKGKIDGSWVLLGATDWVGATVE
jgi:hypothetical protein